MENCLMNYSRLTTELDRLKTEYDFITVSSIGKSLVGRELPLVSIGKGYKKVLYVGSHHGMEWITSLLLLKYIEEYCSAIKRGGRLFGIDCEGLFEMRTVNIVPMLNPDGIELHTSGGDAQNPLTERLNRACGGDYSKWQANGRGVDLNHNYNAGFDEYKRLETEMGITGEAPTRFSGQYPESEPETAAMCSLIRATAPSLLFALHTQGGEIYYDFNSSIPPRGEAIARRMANITGYRLAKPEHAASFGGLKDWFISEFNLPAYTIECGRGENPLPISDCEMIYRGIFPLLIQAPIFI